jgi:hypothetical protein
VQPAFVNADTAPVSRIRQVWMTIKPHDGAMRLRKSTWRAAILTGFRHSMCRCPVRPAHTVAKSCHFESESNDFSMLAEQ